MNGAKEKEAPCVVLQWTHSTDDRYRLVWLSPGVAGAPPSVALERLSEDALGGEKWDDVTDDEHTRAFRCLAQWIKDTRGAWSEWGTLMAGKHSRS